MPALTEYVNAASNLDRERFQPIEGQPTMPAMLPPTNDTMTMSPFLRCPLTPLTSNPDSLRQFYRGGVPQYRIIPIG